MDGLFEMMILREEKQSSYIINVENNQRRESYYYGQQVIHIHIEEEWLEGNKYVITGWFLLGGDNA